MNLINKDGLLLLINKELAFGGLSAKALKRIVQRYPAERDAKVVILCKDCKYYEPDLYANLWGTCFHREWIVGNTGHTVDNDGYCYRAERKEK